MSFSPSSSRHRMENQLNSWGIFSQDFRHCRFFKGSRKVLRRKSIKPEEFTDTIIFMSMFNDIDRSKTGNDSRDWIDKSTALS